VHGNLDYKKCHAFESYLLLGLENGRRHLLLKVREVERGLLIGRGNVILGVVNELRRAAFEATNTDVYSMERSIFYSTMRNHICQTIREGMALKDPVVLFLKVDHGRILYPSLSKPHHQIDVHCIMCPLKRK
jgi:hypothetical protein